MLEHDAEDEQRLIEMACERDEALPQAIAAAPRLHVGLELYWLAFWALLGHRGGMGDGPFQWAAIQTWASYNGLSRDQTEALHHHLREMSRALSKHNAKPDGVRREDSRDRSPGGEGY